MLNGASYPNSIEQPILNFFPIKQPNNLTLNNSQDLYKLYYPYTSTKMSSYQQVTNNKKYWLRPDNGKAIPLGFNSSIYKY